MNTNYKINKPTNEPIKSYVTGTSERLELKTELDKLYNTQTDIPLIIDGKEVFTNITEEFIIPHEKDHVLARYHKATEKELKMAIDALNRSEYRPLEGFVLAISPFNFTAIGENLSTAPAMMGNTIVWKPASIAVYSNYLFMKILMEAGLPAGVINFVPSSGALISEVCVTSKDLAGIHFTGSTKVFQTLCPPTNFEYPYMSDTQPEKSKPEDESYFGLDFISL